MPVIRHSKEDTNTIEFIVEYVRKNEPRLREICLFGDNRWGKGNKIFRRCLWAAIDEHRIILQADNTLKVNNRR